MFNPSPKFKRSARRLALLALPCLALVAVAPPSTMPKVAPPPIVTPDFGTPAPTSATQIVGTPPTNAVTNPPPQGLYEECAPSNQQQCASELAQMGTAGFRLALNYTAWYGSAADIQAYASAAQAQGIKLIWPLNSLPWHSDTSLATTYPALAASCGGCTTNDAIRQYAVNLVRSLPATWGYYIGDEEASSVAPAIAGLARTVRALDPSHQLLYIGQSYPNVVSTLQPFMSSADVIGADVYPIGEGQPTSAVGPIAAKVAQIASAAGKRAAMVLQAFSWTQYPTEIAAINPRWPTETDMHQMLEQAVAANPSMILWYNLSDIQRSDNPAQHWQDLVTAAFGKSPTTSATSSSPTGATTASAGPTTTSTAPTSTTPSTTSPSSSPSTSTSKTSTTSTTTTAPTSTTPVHGLRPAAKRSKPKAAKKSTQKPKAAKRVARHARHVSHKKPRRKK
jgi:hypothetical protein